MSRGLGESNERLGLAETPVAPGPAAAVLPRSFGEYELLEELSRGGMGVVYKALQRSLNRTVAVKMILHGAFASEESLRRFEGEARAAAALDHPNIVPVYAFGQQDGHPYFAMLLVEGENLAALVRRVGPRPPQAAVALLLPVAEAVQYAHQAGIIHRDLKPENVLIDQQGRPRVTDFGVAKQLGNSRMTEAGQILGTPAYMAPEQARGDSWLAGPEVDVYALGGILFFLLTGQPPFVGKTLTDILNKVEHCPVVPPRSFNPEVSEALEAVVLRCLEKDPGRRYPTVAELMAALRDAAGQPSRPTLLALRPGPDALLNALQNDLPEPDREGEASPIPKGRQAGGPPARGRTRSRLLAGLAACLLGFVCLAGLVLWLGPSWFAGTGPAREAPQAEAAETVVLPEPSLHDFKLEVTIRNPDDRAGDVWQFHQGDKLRLQIKVERDAYVGIWTINPRGAIVQLFPNTMDSEYHLKANEPRDIPGNAPYDLNAADVSTAVEHLRVVASTRRWDPLKGETEGPFTVFRNAAERRTIRDHIGRIRDVRGFKPEPRVDGGAVAEVAEFGLKYRILPR
jgi:serine/threonine protein kinase